MSLWLWRSSWAAVWLMLGGCAAPAVTQAPASAPAAAESPAAETGQGATEAAETITASDMFARISFLASDALRGRDTPSAGLNAAAAWVVSEHLRTGLDPAGENGTYYQWFTFTPRRAQGAPPPASEQPRAPNVAAVIPGSDPQLRNEYVILSAHLDHVGVGRPVDGDSIYNGADDNGSGSAALLEVAEALAALPQPPRRSIIILHVSAEEKGLLGSRWYSENPTVPLQSIVANVNVDMIARNSPDSVVVIGMNYSTLGPLVEQVAAWHPELGLTIGDDPWPEERFFFRSDHFNFARKEIPALFFFSGVHEDYHRPSDSVDKLDVDKAARVTRMIFYTALEIANAPARPQWDPAGLAEVRGMTR